MTRYARTGRSTLLPVVDTRFGPSWDRPSNTPCASKHSSILASGTHPTGRLIEGGADEGHEGHLDRFEFLRLMIPFGSNGERELKTRNSEMPEFDRAVCEWNGFYFDILVVSICK
jgi:hypothetical protein